MNNKAASVKLEPSKQHLLMFVDETLLYWHALLWCEPPVTSFYVSCLLLNSCPCFASQSQISLQLVNDCNIRNWESQWIGIYIFLGLFGLMLKLVKTNLAAQKTWLMFDSNSICDRPIKIWLPLPSANTGSDVGKLWPRFSLASQSEMTWHALVILHVVWIFWISKLKKCFNIY
jgi:hypothetical protein